MRDDVCPICYAPPDTHRYPCESADRRAHVARLVRERDEARAQLAAMRAALASAVRAYLAAEGAYVAALVGWGGPDGDVDLAAATERRDEAERALRALAERT